MKANELMIGDWVGRVFDDKRIIEDYRQVDWINAKKVGTFNSSIKQSKNREVI